MWPLIGQEIRVRVKMEMVVVGHEREGLVRLGQREIKVNQRGRKRYVNGSW